MNALSYLDTGRFDSREIRKESAERAEANRLAALQLIAEERKFWNARLSRAQPHEVAVIREELDKLNELETQHHG